MLDLWIIVVHAPVDYHDAPIPCCSVTPRDALAQARLTRTQIFGLMPRWTRDERFVPAHTVH